MSLFIAAKPVGILFADRSQAFNKLDNNCYSGFKTAVLTASRALDYLVKQDSRKAA